MACGYRATNLQQSVPAALFWPSQILDLEQRWWSIIIPRGGLHIFLRTFSQLNSVRIGLVYPHNPDAEQNIICGPVPPANPSMTENHLNVKNDFSFHVDGRRQTAWRACSIEKLEFACQNVHIDQALHKPCNFCWRRFKPYEPPPTNPRKKVTHTRENANIWRPPLISFLCSRADAHPLRWFQFYLSS